MGLGLWVQGLGFRALGLGLRALGCGVGALGVGVSTSRDHRHCSSVVLIATAAVVVVALRPKQRRHADNDIVIETSNPTP